MSRTIIAVDFDGTIVEHRFPAIGDPAPSAFAWLKRFQKLDALLILYTMRSDGRVDGQYTGTNPLTEAVEFCRKHGVEFWAHNDNPEQSWTSSRKVYAHVYIDDAAAGCPLIPHPIGGGMVVDWEQVGPYVEKLILARQEAFRGHAA